MARKSPVIEELERREGRRFRELCEHYAGMNYSRAHAADELGVNRTTFYFACRRICPDVQWPHSNSGQRRRELMRTVVAEKLRQIRIENGSAVAVRLNGKTHSLKSAARELGMSDYAVISRYRSGKRGRALTAPRQVATYDLGLSVAELAPVIEYAQERSVIAAARKFDLPEGAVKALVSGEWERVA